MVSTMQDFYTILYVFSRQQGLLREMYECLYWFWMNCFWARLFDNFGQDNFIIGSIYYFIIYYVIYYLI